ncbi:hypothetical protein [Bacillus sp. P14.5]|uniref:hypothetical protein n=1 Tax=Bacillus sp. P14.5 TaxID=1983400 RepID=UPI001F05B707|nr:hypothetical protein [Bacillus sp. P14.5]
MKKNRSRMIIGTAAKVSKEIKRIAEAFAADEVMIIPNVSGIKNRKKSLSCLQRNFFKKFIHISK